MFATTKVLARTARVLGAGSPISVSSSSETRKEPSAPCGLTDNKDHYWVLKELAVKRKQNAQSRILERPGPVGVELFDKTPDRYSLFVERR
jgi:hypothetical protein